MNNESQFTQNYELFSTLIIIRNVSFQQIISEDHVTLKSNDAENTALNQRNKLYLTI